MNWKIEPAQDGWWLFYQGNNAWWHTYYDKWCAVFPTLDAVFEKIKEKT
jgi:hypothetical protein